MTAIAVMQTVAAMDMRPGPSRAAMHKLVERCASRRLPHAALPAAVSALLKTADPQPAALARTMAALHWRILAQTDLSTPSASRNALREALVAVLRVNWDCARAFMLALSDSLEELPTQSAAVDVLVLLSLAECHGLRAEAAACLARSCGAGRLSREHCEDAFVDALPTGGAGGVAACVALLDALTRSDHAHVRRWCGILSARLYLAAPALRGPLALLVLDWFRVERGLEACDMLEAILDNDTTDGAAMLLECAPLLSSEIIISVSSWLPWPFRRANAKVGHAACVWSLCSRW